MWREKICASEGITVDQESSVTKQTPGKTRHDLVNQANLHTLYYLRTDRCVCEKWILLRRPEA